VLKKGAASSFLLSLCRRLVIVIGPRGVNAFMAIPADAFRIYPRTFPIEIVIVSMMTVEIE
jgi:hypothetical protein